MSIRIRKPTLRAFVATTLLGVPLAAINACSETDSVANASPSASPAAMGRLELALSATAGDERVYRLKHATFTLTAKTGSAVREVRADAELERFSLELAAGVYEVLLQAGYELELVAADGSASPVESTLISPNPAVVNIAADAVTSHDFMFQVGGVEVQTGTSGVLDLGIDVVGAGEGPELDCSDIWEPNDDQPLATPLVPGAALEASVCGRDADYYQFAAPVPAGDLFTVKFAFDTDRFSLISLIFDPAIVADAPFEDVVASGEGQDDYEVLLVSNGGEYLLRAFMGFDAFEGEGADPDPALDEGVGYSISLGEYVNTAMNSCCTTSATGGCSDDEVNACMCAANAYCCRTSFDELCVTEAILECGAECPLPPPESDCCSASSAPGCAVSDVQACVCDVNPYCCFGAFDDNCVALAQAQCGAACSP